MSNFDDHVKASAPNAVLIDCPSCSQPGFVDTWTRITSTIDRQATKKLLEGSLFTYTCPVCGEKTAVAYDCLYYDVERKTFLLYSTSPQAESEGPAYLNDLLMLEQAQMPGEEDGALASNSGEPDSTTAAADPALPNSTAADPALPNSTESEPEASIPLKPAQVYQHDKVFDEGTYQGRLVTHTFEFCEKARILQEGYDDRAIELLKVAIKRGMLKDGIIGSRDTLIYERTMLDGGISFVVMGEVPGDVVGVPQGYSYCVRYLNEHKDQLEGEWRFDARWANSFLA